MVDRKGNLNCKLDLGSFLFKSIWDKPVNYNLALKTDVNLKGFWVRFGKTYKDKNIEWHSRVE